MEDLATNLAPSTNTHKQPLGKEWNKDALQHGAILDGLQGMTQAYHINAESTLEGLEKCTRYYFPKLLSSSNVSQMMDLETSMVCSPE